MLSIYYHAKLLNDKLSNSKPFMCHLVGINCLKQQRMAIYNNFMYLDNLKYLEAFSFISVLMGNNHAVLYFWRRHWKDAFNVSVLGWEC